MNSFKEKTVLITGGSRGLGRALALELTLQGAKVVAAARPSEALRSLAEKVEHALAFDVGDKAAIYPFVARVAELVGPIDLLINNASTLGPIPLDSLLDTTCEDFEKVLMTNLIGPFRLTKALLGSMILRGPGTVLNISSDAAVSAYPNWGAYSVSKAASDHLTRIWAAELAETRIRFLSLDPGEMDTAMHADAMPEADRTKLAIPAEVANRIIRILESDFRSGERMTS